MRKHIGTSMVAGAVGGLIGTWAMSEFQGWWTETVNGRRVESAAGRHDARDWQEKIEGQNANEIAAQQIATVVRGRPLNRDELAVGAALTHYAFGAAMGALYGALASNDRTPAGAGAAWGTAVWLGADEIAMPLLGLSRADVDYPLEAHLQSFSAHLVFGGAIELVHRIAIARTGRRGL